jgi:hypothetical protein
MCSLHASSDTLALARARPYTLRWRGWRALTPVTYLTARQAARVGPSASSPTGPGRSTRWVRLTSASRDARPMLQPFDSELGDFVEEICADLCRFECAATAGCEPAQVSVEREVALGTTLSPTSGSRRQRARVLLAPQRTAVVQGVVRGQRLAGPGHGQRCRRQAGGHQLPSSVRGQDVRLGRQIWSSALAASRRAGSCSTLRAGR